MIAKKDQTTDMRHPKIGLTVDLVIQKEEDEVLLIERKSDPFKGRWALPGGFVEEGEEILTAALRELKEETGVEVTEDELTFLGYFDAPDRDPRGRVVSFGFGAVVPGNTRVEAGDDAACARWFSIHRLPELAFDHRTILALWFEN